MKFNLNRAQDKPVIMVKEDSNGEVSITTVGGEKKGVKKYWPWVVGAAAIVAVIGLAWGGYHYYKTYVNIGIPVSFSSKQNIQKLESNPAGQKGASQVIMTTDSTGKLPLEIYELSNLKAEIVLDRPDSTDTDVYLYCRSSNFTNNDPKVNQYYGSLIINGKSMPESTTRPLIGYVATKGDNFVIGVAKDDDVKDYCEDNGGCFFRQFVLVSANILPNRFYIEGRGKRQCLARIDDTDSGTSKYYYIRTNTITTIPEFAKVLRDYGVTDAIYIPGSDEYSYYRTPDGQLHDIGNPAHKTEKNGVIPWLVFKKK